CGDSPDTPLTSRTRSPLRRLAMPTKSARTSRGGQAQRAPRHEGNGRAAGRIPLTQTRDSITDVWGPRTPYAGDWPARVDERLEEQPDQWVQSCCLLCSNGCALDIGVKGGRVVGVRGREADRVNRG